MNADRINLRLVDLLQKDARQSISELSRQLGRSESTIRERLASLERGGAVRRYEAIVDPRWLGYEVRAIVRADPPEPASPNLAKDLASIPNVVMAMATTGDRPLRIHLVARNLADLERVVEERLGPLGLRRVETGAVMQWLVEPRPPSVPVEVATNGFSNGVHGHSSNGFRPAASVASADVGVGAGTGSAPAHASLTSSFTK